MTTPRPARRHGTEPGVDYAALATWIQHHDPPPDDWPTCTDTTPVGWIARRLHRPPALIYRWRDAGRIPIGDADRAAIELGVHPIGIWTNFHRAAA